MNLLGECKHQIRNKISCEVVIFIFTFTQLQHSSTYCVSIYIDNYTFHTVKGFERIHFIIEKTERKAKSWLKLFILIIIQYKKISNVHMIWGIHIKNNILKMNAITCIKVPHGGGGGGENHKPTTVSVGELKVGFLKPPLL